VEELLEISELDSDHPPIRWERVDLRALAEAIARRRRMDAVVSGAEAVTWADKARVERILGNLLDNAAQHGRATTVEVRVGVRAGWCEVVVNDRGPGISSEDLPHLFERFYKADSSRTPGAGGIGLGLAIAAANAETLDGSIEARERRGGGASFLLRLPRLDRPPGPVGDPTDPEDDP
jgi:signal transduction histidine kinase